MVKRGTYTYTDRNSEKDKKNVFFHLLFLITLFAFVGINIMSIDSIVATSFPPTVNKEIDYIYIVKLSPDAASSWPFIIQHAQSQWDTLSKLTSPTDDQTRKIGNLNSTLRILRWESFWSWIENIPLIPKNIYRSIQIQKTVQMPVMPSGKRDT